jgi:hypothetical protein
MRYYVELNDELLRDLDACSLESCQYNLSAEQVADLRDYVEDLGYDWQEIAYVQRMLAVA